MYIHKEVYNKEYFERMLDELERSNITQENGELKQNVVRKDYQDGSVYIGEVG